MSHYREIADLDAYDGWDFDVFGDETDAPIRAVISLAREAIAIAVTKGNRSGFMVDTQFEIETQARRLLLDALITLRPEYVGVLYALRKSESDPSDYGRQADAYAAAEREAARLNREYADRMHGEDVL